MSTFLNMRPHEKTAILIDGANLYKAARNLGFDMDYKSLIAKAREHSSLLRAYYYTAIQEDKSQDYSPLRPLVDWLDYNGYTMVTKTTREFIDQQGRKRFKGSVDIELAVDMMVLAPQIDHMIIFSGNGDFRRAIEAVQAQGVRVTVISTMNSEPPMASDELRRQADVFLELENLADKIGRSTNAGRHSQNHDDDDDDIYEGDYDDYAEDEDI